MNQPRRKRPQNRRQPNQKPKAKAKPLDLWRPVPSLPEPDPIVPTGEPASLIRSLGDPPLQGQGAVAEHYIAAVVEAAANLAVALAAASSLLAPPVGDDPDEQA